MQELHDILKLLQRCKCNPKIHRNANSEQQEMEKIKGIVKVRKPTEPKGETKLARHGRYPPFLFSAKFFKVSIKHTKLCNE